MRKPARRHACNTLAVIQMRQTKTFFIVLVLLSSGKSFGQVILSTDLLDTVLTRYFYTHPISDNSLYVETFMSYRREGEEIIDFDTTARPVKIGKINLTYVAWHKEPRPKFKDNKKGYKLLSFDGRHKRHNGDSLIIPLILCECYITKEDDVSHCNEINPNHDSSVILILNRQRDEYEFDAFKEQDF